MTTKKKPIGFVAICQCGYTVGAIDLERTNKFDAGKIIGKWISDGCLIEPRFKSGWCATINGCVCEKPNLDN